MKTTTRKNNKILLVEDDKLNQMVMGTFLEEVGFPFDVAENGKDALHLAETISYQLILMDIGLPDMTGDRVAVQIRQTNSASNHSPIVAITTHGEEEIHLRCQQAGINGCLQKPISQSALRLLVHQYIQEV